MKKIAIAASALLFVPSLAFAQAVQSGYITSILELVKTIISYVIPILFSLAFIVFVYGVITYVISGDSEKKEHARSVMIYGIIGLAVMASVWGIVSVLQNIFQVGGTSNVTVPSLPNIP